MADLGGVGPNGLGGTAAIHAGGILGPLARAQYGALARLRWRMFSNGMRSNKGLVELGARTFSYIVYALMGLALGVGAGITSYFLVAGNAWRFFRCCFGCWPFCGRQYR